MSDSFVLGAQPDALMPWHFTEQITDQLTGLLTNLSILELGAMPRHFTEQITDQLTGQLTDLSILELGAIDNGHGIYTHHQAAPVAHAAPVALNSLPPLPPLPPLPVTPATHASTTPNARMHMRHWTPAELADIEYLLARGFQPRRIQEYSP